MEAGQTDPFVPHGYKPGRGALQHRSATMLRLYSTQQPLACPTLSATMPPGSPGKPVGQDWPSLATFKAWEANGSRSNGQTPRSPPARQHTSKEAAFLGEVERLGSVDFKLAPKIGRVSHYSEEGEESVLAAKTAMHSGSQHSIKLEEV